MKHGNSPLRFNALPAFCLTLVLASFACGALPASAPVNSNHPPPAVALSTATPAILEPLPMPTEVHLSPAIPESRRLTLDYPPKMRAGVEGDVIRLTLEVDDLGNLTPTAQVEGNVVTGEIIEVPNLYDTHNVTAEARLDLAGMVVQPSNAILEPLQPGQAAKFFWSVRPEQAGIYRGTVWLHLNFVDRSSGEASRIALSAQFIEIEAVDFFGLPVNVARTSGMIGSVVGGIIGFPFIEDILKFIFRRRRR